LTHFHDLLYFKELQSLFGYPFTMSLKLIAGLGCGFLLVSAIGLMVLNPSLADYRADILTTLALQEADRAAAGDRRAIEQEAARLASEFAAVHYDPAKLDAARVRRFHPLLGAALVEHAQMNGKTLTETLALSKEHALRRIAATQETMRYGILVKLDAATSRVSYGLWSVYSTCLDRAAFAYTGVAGRFYPRAFHDCGTRRPLY
jgi:hypothetical protein